MEPYPVYFEKEGEFVAEFKFTALLMPNGTMKITGIPVDLECYQTDNQILDETIKVSDLSELMWSELEEYDDALRKLLVLFSIEIVGFFVDHQEEEEEDHYQEGRWSWRQEGGRGEQWRRIDFEELFNSSTF